MFRRQARFLVKQTLTAVLLNGVFSALAVFLAFRHMAIVPLSGSPSLITDSIFQTFIATLMSILPPSILTAKWMLSKPARTSTARILIRAFSTALAVCLASFIILPFVMPRLLAASLPFWNMLFLKCLYGMAIGLAVTPFAVAAVLRGPRRGSGTASSIEQR